MNATTRIEIHPRPVSDPLTISRMAGVWVDTWTKAMPQIDFAARHGWIVEQIGLAACTLTAHDSAKPIDHNNLLGFALLDPVSGQLNQLAVASESYGSGAARTILNKVKDLCGKIVTLDVNADNHRAVRFYEREGFVRQGFGVNEQSGLSTIAMRWTRTR